MEIIVGRHINGIFINDLEYLLDDDKEPMRFKSEEEATRFLKSKGVTDDEIYCMVFKKVVGKQDAYFMTDQPEVCRSCGARTEFQEDSNGMQFHTCMDPACRYEYVLVSEGESS